MFYESIKSRLKIGANEILIEDLEFAIEVKEL